MTPDLDALERAALAATPGEWVIERHDDDDGSISYEIWAGGENYGRITVINDEADSQPVKANAEHIATSNPAAVLSLIRAFRESEAKIAAMGEVLEEVGGIFRQMAVGGAVIQDETVRRVREILSTLPARAAEMIEAKKERGKDRALIKRLSDALLKARPLGGSECFIKHGDGYVANPDFLRAAIEENNKRLHEAKRSEMLALKELKRYQNWFDAKENTLRGDCDRLEWADLREAMVHEHEKELRDEIIAERDKAIAERDTAAQGALDKAWKAIEERASSLDMRRAPLFKNRRVGLFEAQAIIESLGGMDPEKRRAGG